MADFEVVVTQIASSEKHPDADRLAVSKAKGMDFTFITGWDPETNAPTARVGSWGAYIPEGALLPPDLIEEMDLGTALAGKAHNRVKAKRIRGIVSQGLWYPFASSPAAEFFYEQFEEGDNIAAELGITKYEPVVPAQLSGKMQPAPVWWRGFDVEDVKKYPSVLTPDDFVVATEKLHGSCCIIGVGKTGDNWERFVSSKGVGGRGLTIIEDPANAYWRVAIQEDLHAKLIDYCEFRGVRYAMLFGEMVGVQDLMYGLKRGQLDFYAFDLFRVDDDMRGRFEDAIWLPGEAALFGFKRVPTLYRGHYDHDALVALATGPSTIEGANHIREGIVVKPDREQFDPKLGRVMVKYISPDYLFRSGETTELQ